MKKMKSKVKVKKSIKKEKVTKTKQYYLVRTESAGVFTGYIKKKKGQEVIMTKARRIWYWDGASSLSELAVRGVSRPENCKFPCEVDVIELLKVIEIIPMTKEAEQSIKNVQIWTQF